MLSCETRSKNHFATEDENCDFKFEIEVESSSSYKYNSESGQLKKLINPFKEDELYADTTFFIPKKNLCELRKVIQTYEIAKYPREFHPESEISMTPEPSYHLQFVIDNQETEINWTRNTGVLLDNEDAFKLHEIINKIDSIILSSPEFQTLPKQEYDWL